MIEKATTKKISPDELQRYARHIVLRDIGGSGQTKLKNAKVLVIGAGGLGTPVLQYLNAAGVGAIKLVDFDKVNISNLQRQVIFDETQVGLSKVESARKNLLKQNPYTDISIHEYPLDEANVDSLVGNCDVVVDGTDNFASRKVVNRCCMKKGIPLVFGAISQWEGQVTVFTGKPCYECIFPEEPTGEMAQTCSELGVLGSLPGIIGTIMASETIKLITGAGKILERRLLIWDALYGESRTIRTAYRKDCPACGVETV
ncbi:MAG: HesA/MoeB/ThiF family protein [Rhodobacteraceae bacterium]|nr:HesA/MoeB/ThiF family protein [Paracoccaceae bacterium]